MNRIAIHIWLAVAILLGMFVGGTQFYTDVAGLPAKNQTKPLCTNECPAEADMPPLLVAHPSHLPLWNSTGENM